VFEARRHRATFASSSAAGCITTGFPPLRQPKPEIADRGTVRLGSGSITGYDKELAAAMPETARLRKVFHLCS